MLKSLQSENKELLNKNRDLDLFVNKSKEDDKKLKEYENKCENLMIILEHSKTLFNKLLDTSEKFK